MGPVATDFIGELVDIDWRLGVVCATDHAKKMRELYVRVKFVVNRSSSGTTGKDGQRSFWLELTIPQFYQMLQELEKAQASLRRTALFCLSSVALEMPSTGLSIDFSQFKIDWLFRKKQFTPSNVASTSLNRCLGLLELTALGIGATLGAGIYVVTPDSTRTFGGPAMCVAFVIAAFASVLSGLCYAELGARIPRAGSAYVYSYVAVGELLAFIVGWNMILEYVIGTASVARAAVTYIDVLANGALEKFFRAHMPLNVPFLGEYVDPIAFSITLFLTILLAIGVHESTFVNNILVLINSGILVYVIIVGFIYADTKNWSLTQEEVQQATNSTEFGTGGFMPYGFGGVMTAASAAFYSFVGFDCIATTGEEVSNPRRNIPLSIVLSLIICAVAYFCVSIVFSLDTPYYNLTQKTLLPNVPYGTIVVSVGAILCSSTSLLGGLFPLPRIVYAMADDGLLFSFLAKVSPRFKTPMVATVLSGFLTAIFASMFDVNQLVDMLSIGTLMAYSLVAASVLVLRYRESFIDIVQDECTGTNSDVKNDENTLLYTASPGPIGYVKALFSCKKITLRATSFTSMLAIILSCMAALTGLGAVTFAMVLVEFADGHLWPLAFIITFALLTMAIALRLWRLPQNRGFTSFQVPGVPFLPVATLCINFYLLVSLNVDTWIRFAVWMAIGAVVFVFYGIWASKERYFQLQGSMSSAPASYGADDIEVADAGGSATLMKKNDDGIVHRAASSSLSGVDE